MLHHMTVPAHVKHIWSAVCVCVLPVSGLLDSGDRGRYGGEAVSGVCSCVWECVCNSSRQRASRVCPREWATARGRRPRESGIPRAALLQRYNNTAAAWWPRAHAHIWTHTQQHMSKQTHSESSSHYLLVCGYPYIHTYTHTNTLPGKSLCVRVTYQRCAGEMINV